MKIRELAEYCSSIEIDCDKCEHKELCDGLQYKLEDISPLGLIDLVDENKGSYKCQYCDTIINPSEV